VRQLVTELPRQRRWLRRILTAAAIALPLAPAADTSSAEGLFGFFFGANQKQQPQASFFDKVFDVNLQPQPASQPVAASLGRSGSSFCVRTCDIFR
jgi:hypothetical protein